MPAARRLLVWIVIAAAVAAGLLAPRLGLYWRERRLRAGAAPFDVLVITLDTTRADRLGCYGGPAGVSPHLDRLASDGVRFREAYAHVPLTLPSHASLFTARLPPAHGLHDNGVAGLPREVRTLAEILHEDGYATAAFVSAFVLDRRFGLARGFSHYEDDVTGGGRDAIDASVPGHVTVDRALRWLDRPETRPRFLWVHLYDPHDPYEPPPPFDGLFPGRPYEGEIAAADAQVGRLLAAVDESRKAGRETLVVAVGDHGESLGEHGEPTHGYFVYGATQRVPLLISLPGRLSRGRVIEPLVRLVDVMPTVLDLLGRPAPEGLDGRSLVGLLTGRERAGPGPAYVESHQPRLWWGAQELVGVRSGPWLYIRSPRPELYDVSADPGETRNLGAARPAEREALEARLQSLLRTPGPTSPATADPEAARGLQALGYVAGGLGPVPSASGALPDAKDNAAALKDAGAAQSLAAAGRWEEALRAYRDALRAHPGSLFLREREAALLLERGRHDEAMSAYEGLAASRPDDSRYALARVLCRTRAGRLDEALSLAREGVARFPGDASLREEAGVLLLGRGRLAEAEQELRRAVELSPARSAPRLALSAALARQERREEAVQSYRETVRINPASAEAREAALSLSGLGDELSARQSWESAEAAYRGAIEGGRGTPEVYLNLGLALYRSGRREACLAAIREGAARHPQSAALQDRLARLLAATGAR